MLTGQPGQPGDLDEVATVLAYALSAVVRTRGSPAGSPRTCPKLAFDQRRFIGHSRYDSCAPRGEDERGGAGGTCETSQPKAL